jgi:hypothetical protein
LKEGTKLSVRSLPTFCPSPKPKEMVFWEEEFPQLVSRRHKLLRKINKMREEWDELWDLLLLLQYSNRSP